MRQSRTSAEARWVASPSRRSSAGESRPIASPRRRRLGAGADHGPLDRPRAPRLDQLAADRPQHRLGDRRQPQRPQPGELADRPAEQRIRAEAAPELRRVVVEREHEAEELDPGLVRRAQRHRPVAPLPREPAAAAGKRALEDVAARAQPQRVRPDRPDDCLDHRIRPYCCALMRLVDAISLRSRRRKLGLFLETIRPTAETTVLDIGVDDVGFGEIEVTEHGSCGTLNYFEQAYPWPERITALGQHEGTRFTARYPAVRYVQGNAAELPFEDASFDVVYSNAVIEHVGGARGAAPLRRRGAARRAAGVHHDPESLVPGRRPHAAAASPLAARAARPPRLRARRASPGRRRTACSAPAIWRSSFRTGRGS